MKQLFHKRFSYPFTTSSTNALLRNVFLFSLLSNSISYGAFSENSFPIDLPTSDVHETATLLRFQTTVLLRSVAAKVPELRPKGLGLGADRSLAAQLKKDAGGHTGSKYSNQSNKEDMKIKKGAFVKIVGGPNRDNYGKVSG